MDVLQKTLSNHILARLLPADFSLLRPWLQTVDLPVRKLLEGRNRKIEHVYFLESGLASVVVSGGTHHSLEVGMIGREGLTGLPLVLGTDRSPNETFIQSAGHGWRIAAGALSDAMEKSHPLRRHLTQHAYAMTVQMSYTALSNGRYRVDERLARWLLMAHDRAEGATVTLTHEFLSIMLGVRRPGVTTALNDLERRGVITTARGTVTILDRSGLEGSANGSYGAFESEYVRLFGVAAAA